MKRLNVMEQNSTCRIYTDHKSEIFPYSALTRPNYLKLILKIFTFGLFSHEGIWVIIRSECILIILNPFPNKRRHK